MKITIIVGMRFGKLALNLLKYIIKNDIRKRRKHYPPHLFDEFINVPYIDDNNINHTYDVYLAKEENKKHVCIINIHGGTYIFGEHKDNYPYVYEWLNEGYDALLVDYQYNNGNLNIHDLVSDSVKCINHFLNNLKKYNLEKDRFVISGDSAGGHFALLISELFSNKELQTKLGLELPDINIVATVLHCPVYDFANIGDGALSPSGLKRMLGPKGIDKNHLSIYSPKTYIDGFKNPIFVSTCTNDFIRKESLKINADLSKRGDFLFVDIESDDKNIGHVHNVINIELKESKRVNRLAMEFVSKYL